MNHAQDENPKEHKIESLKAKGHEISETEAEEAEYGTGSSFYAFGRDVKDRFLSLAPKMWPNVGKLCRAVGISRDTYYYHIKQDKVFRAAMEEIKESRLDDLEETNMNEGQGTGKEAFLPRISTLKAYRKQIYDPAKVLRVEGLQMGNGERVQRLGAVDGAVDAEIVKTYLDRKQRRELKQQEQLKSGESGQGGSGVEGGGGSGKD